MPFKKKKKKWYWLHCSCFISQRSYEKTTGWRNKKKFDESRSHEASARSFSGHRLHGEAKRPGLRLENTSWLRPADCLNPACLHTAYSPNLVFISWNNQISPLLKWLMAVQPVWEGLGDKGSQDHTAAFSLAWCVRAKPCWYPYTTREEDGLESKARRAPQKTLTREQSPGTFQQQEWDSHNGMGPDHDNSTRWCHSAFQVDLRAWKN